ncbi:MAG: hypothetical protein M9958_11950 [Chitinophagales bacterium]|nr:hypothetical protein [Chitinophagales bacterium]
MSNTPKTKSSQKKNNHSNTKYWILLLLFSTLFMGGAGYLLKETKGKFHHSRHKINNSKYETKRINGILDHHSDKILGIDISHYQSKDKIKWENFTIGDNNAEIKFIVMRATMGKNGKDKHFNEYWEKAKDVNLIRGAYHYYRPHEDPEKQAKWFLKNIDLQQGDLHPILDIEKYPRGKSKEDFHKDLKIWLKIVEEAYGKQPIIYSYYSFYNDYLRGEFEEYPLWMANYRDVLVPSKIDNWAFWQFTEKGIVSNIKTKVDVNIFNGKLSQLKKYTI